MFIWRVWGDVWQIGDGQDYLTHLIVSLLISVVLVLVTAVIVVAVITPIYTYRGIRALVASPETPQLLPPEVGPDGPGVGSHDVTFSLRPVACPNCGNTKSLDIQPCIGCGEWI